MPRPRAELRGRLRYRVCGPGPRLSLLHVRLSAAAARALRGCGRRQVGPGRGGPGEPGADGTHRRPLLLQGAPGPVIAFQGSQGCLTVPGSPGTTPRFFAFSLSHCSRDEPQGSFECARLAVPRLGQSWLDSLGSIQEKITVCARESTCPLLRERVSPAKEPCSRAAVEPDPAVLGYGKGVTAPEKVAVTGPLGKGSACHVHVPTTASPRASVQSLIQRRALRPLEGMPAGRPSGARLLAVLEEVRVPAAAPARLRECCSMPTLLRSPEVTKLDPTACCYRMKGTLAGRAKEDWPGNTAQEQQQAALPQHRSQDGRSSAPSFLVPLHQPPEHGSPQATGRNLPGVSRWGTLQHQVLALGSRTGLRQSEFIFQKRLALLDFSDPRASKRSRAPASGPGLQEWHRSCPQTLSTQHPGAQGQQQAGPLPLSSHAGELENPESEDETGDDWEESARHPEQHLSAPRGPPERPLGSPRWARGSMPTRAVQLQARPWGRGPPVSLGAGQVLAKVEERCSRRALNLVIFCSLPDARSQARSSSLAEIPDYLRRKYHTIGSAEQCRAYEAAFSADYTEYRYLHARIGNVSQKFIQLGAKMKTLEQGTEERKALEATILHEYSHFKKTYPSYQQEKNRCEYLHQKLSHIKSLILQFEGGSC
ncbi:RNA polymerase II elongation factor ELL3 [Spheniscus humboldti]